jgi:Flp pilus assembly protein TadG
LNERERRQGQGLVEFALILPVFVLLILVVFDLGRAVYAQHTIENAARAGARVAIVNQDQSAVANAAMGAAVGLDAAVVGVDTSRLKTSCPPPTGMKIGCTTEVSVTYQFRPLTPIVGTIVGPMTLNARTRIPVERVYEAAP